MNQAELAWRLLSLLVAFGLSCLLTGTVAERLGAVAAARHIPEAPALSPRGEQIAALAAAREAGDLAALAALMDAGEPALARAAAQSAAAALGEGWPEDFRGDFLRARAPEVLLSGRASGLPPSVTLAQAALESGWGRSTLARRYNNLFGMKAGRTGAPSVLLETVEGEGWPATARFRRYEHPAESVADHAALIASSPAYAAAREQAGDWRAYLAALAPTYATDPAYAYNLSALIRRYDLERLDQILWSNTG